MPQIIQRIHAHGIAVQAGIVFGFDSDTPAIFDETLDFLEQAGCAERDLQHPDALPRHAACSSGWRQRAAS